MNKKLILWLLILGIITIMVGCSKEKEIVFKGEGTDWTASYRVNIKNNETVPNQGKYTIRYRGDSESIDRVKYEIKSYFLNESGEDILKNGEIVGTTSDHNPHQNVKELELTLEWNDNQEKITLKKQ